MTPGEQAVIDKRFEDLETKIKAQGEQIAMLQAEMSASNVAVAGKPGEVRTTMLGAIQALCRHTGLKLHNGAKVEERVTPGTGIEPREFDTKY